MVHLQHTGKLSCSKSFNAGIAKSTARSVALANQNSLSESSLDTTCVAGTVVLHHIAEALVLVPGAERSSVRCSCNKALHR